MDNIGTRLTEKDKKLRDFVLSADLWRVVLYVCIPLAAYQVFGQIFTILDNIMAAHISTSAVSAVAYLSQINMIIYAFGNGLAVGAGMKISEAYGAGDYTLVKKRVSTVYALSIIVGGIILALILPFNRSFLVMNNTPTALIDEGEKYFAVSLIATVLSFVNSVYISVERARGNSRKILLINIAAILIKAGLTAIFVYVLNGSVVSIAYATLIAQGVFLIIALFNMNIGGDNVFAFSPHAVSFSKDCSSPMLIKAFPVVVERGAFSYGKLVINSMSTDYGELTVGALGISNNIGGISTSIQNGFQDGGAAIISQNIGAGKIPRALGVFARILIINILIGVFFFILTLVNIDFISGLFSGSDENFRLIIKGIYFYEAFGALTLGINAAVMALLYGFGYTKTTLFLNVVRVFVFRIPVLWYFQNFTDIGSNAVGMVMMISNISVGICAAIAAIIVIKKIKKREQSAAAKNEIGG